MCVFDSTRTLSSLLKSQFVHTYTKTKDKTLSALVNQLITAFLVNKNTQYTVEPRHNKVLGTMKMI